MHQHRGADAGVLAGEVVEHALQPIRIGGLGLAPLAAKGQVKQQRVELAQQAGLNQAAVGVAGQQHALAGAAEAEQGGLEQSGGAIDAVPTPRHPHGFGSVLLAEGHRPLRLEWTADLRQFRQVPHPRPSFQQPPQFSWQGGAASMGRQKQGPADGAVQQPQQNHGPGWISLKSDPVLIGIDALQPWARFPLVVPAALGVDSEVAPGALDSGGAGAGVVAAGAAKAPRCSSNSLEASSTR